MIAVIYAMFCLWRFILTGETVMTLDQKDALILAALMEISAEALCVPLYGMWKYR